MSGLDQEVFESSGRVRKWVVGVMENGHYKEACDVQYILWRWARERPQMTTPI